MALLYFMSKINQIPIMKKLTTVLLLLVVCLSINAQKLNLSDPLPVNTKIKKGLLPNGMTYYIYNTNVTKNAASYYIIQNVGSVLEDDNQQGLAHFLEHMAFNGTKNFKDKGILNTLQKHGAVFGKDINAYTSFDETVYNMNNIPTTPELIDTCLLVLHDWSHHLLLTDKEIDAERGVIKEEWRTRQNGGMRILGQTLPTLFNNSKYANRLPIGKMDIVDNFKYKALRDFYNDWYRPDLQAIAVIGDVDVDALELQIKALFSNIPGVENPKERFVVGIPDNNEMLYGLAMDEEVSTAQISFGIRHAKSLENETVADLKKALLTSMITSMFSARISEITQRPDAAFLGARISYGSNSRSTNAFTFSISPKTNQQQQAFKAILEEVNRGVKFGFTQGEIDRTVIQFKNYYETKISKEGDRSHASIESDIQKNYLENLTITDSKREYELVKALFADLKKEDVHQRLQQLYTSKNRYLTVTGVKGNSNLTKIESLNIIKSVENDNTLTAYTDGFAGKTLISNLVIKKGKIVAERVDKSIGATTFTLSNGVVVHYKFADKNKNDVSLSALSYGGMSLINDVDLPSANVTTSVVQQSGLGDYSATDLTKMLAGKTASTTINIAAQSESVSGSAVTKDVETMLQMVYLRFVKPRFDSDSFEVFKGQIDNYIVRRSNDINEKIKDSITVALYGDTNPKERLFTTAYANEINFTTIKNIYLDRFKDASDFEFFIVGDIQKEILKSYLEKYIASIPSSNTKEEWKDNSVNWLSNSIDKDVYLKMEDPKSSVRIAYKNSCEYNLKNIFLARTLGDILKLKYTETLREEEGGTYGASATARVFKRPVQEATISVSFDCNPDKVEKLTSIVHNELKKIASGTVSQVDLDKTIMNYLKERTQQKDYNRYDMSLLTNYYREGYNMNSAENFEDILNAITVDDIQAFTQKLLLNAESYEIIIKPKK